MDPLVITIVFGLGIAVVQLVVAASLIAIRMDLPFSALLTSKIRGAAANRQAVRSGEKSASDILSPVQFKNSQPGKDPSLSERLYNAGFLSAKERKRFFAITFVIGWTVAAFSMLLSFIYDIGNVYFCGIAGAGLVYSGAVMLIDYLSAARALRIIKDLPVAIDQLHIYISGATLLLPAMESFIEHTRTRETPNIVGDYFEQVITNIKAGVSVTDSFKEVAEKSGSQPLIHAFLFLSNCETHGSAILDQLASLSEQVTTSYQITIQEKIIKLPVKATGPLFLVFAGFFVLTSSGVFSKMLTALPLDP